MKSLCLRVGKDVHEDKKNNARGGQGQDEEILGSCLVQGRALQGGTGYLDGCVVEDYLKFVDDRFKVNPSREQVMGNI